MLCSLWLSHTNEHQLSSTDKVCVTHLSLEQFSNLVISDHNLVIDSIQLNDLLPTFLLYVAILSTWFGFRKRFGESLFYFIFVLTVTASVQLVGIYLVFSSLIIPAIGTVRMKGHKRSFTSYLIGISGYIIGLLSSSVLDLPSGAIIVWSLAICSGMVFISYQKMKNSMKP